MLMDWKTWYHKYVHSLQLTYRVNAIPYKTSEGCVCVCVCVCMCKVADEFWNVYENTKVQEYPGQSGIEQKGKTYTSLNWEL